MDNFPVDACISREDFHSLTSLLQGFPDLSVQYIGPGSLFLKANSPIETTLKIRPDANLSSNKKVSKTYREVEFSLAVAARIVRKPTKTVVELVRNQHWQKGAWSSMAQIDLGRGQIFSGLSLQPIIAFGIDAQNWVRKYRESNNGECPDDLREFIVKLIKILSWLHERCMSPNGFLLDSIGFCHGKLNPVLTELAGGAVGKSGRQYIAYKPTPDPQNISQTSSNDKSVKIVQTNHIEELLNKQPLSLLSPCDLETSRLTRRPVRIAERSIEAGHDATLALAACRDNDSESVAKCFLMLLTGWNEQQINPHMDGLKRAKSVEEFARIIDWPPGKQRTTLPRLLGAVQNLLSENRKSLADAHISRQFQFVILNGEQTEQSLNGGIQVPAGFTVPNKLTKSRNKTPPVSIRQAQNTEADPKHGKRGLCVFAEGEIKEGQFVMDYGGQVVPAGGTPSLWSVSLRHQISTLDGGFCSEFPLETAIQERAFGSLFNSNRIVHDKKRPGNVRLVRKLAYIDQNGYLKIPMEATRDIKAGEELLWCYDFKAGAAGDLVAVWSDEDEDEEFKAKESKGTCNGYCMCC